MTFISPHKDILGELLSPLGPDIIRVMDNLTEVELAYAAGFFDGDGTCNIKFMDGSIHVNVSITQKDRDCLDWMQKRFGGSIRTERDRYWRWQPPTKEIFLRAIAPYLVMKKERVERLLSEYYDDAALRYGSAGLPQGIYEKREALCIWFRSVTLATVNKPSTPRR